jgi:hypothetical protein
MRIIPQPRIFLKSLPPAERRAALRELRAVAGSGQHLDRFALAAAWFRQTRIPQVRAALERFFEEVAR